MHPTSGSCGDLSPAEVHALRELLDLAVTSDWEQPCCWCARTRSEIHEHGHGEQCRISAGLAIAEAHNQRIRAPLEAQIAALTAEIRTIAEESMLPDGDGVTVPVVLWAESVLERFATIADGG